MMRELAISSDIAALLDAGAPVAIGVSGGKDSVAAAFATVSYLYRIRHTGPCILIHSDLGRKAVMPIWALVALWSFLPRPPSGNVRSVRSGYGSLLQPMRPEHRAIPWVVAGLFVLAVLP